MGWDFRARRMHDTLSKVNTERNRKPVNLELIDSVRLQNPKSSPSQLQIRNASWTRTLVGFHVRREERVSSIAVLGEQQAS